MAVSYAVSRVLRRASPFLFQKRCESTMASLTKDEILILLRPPFTNWSNVIQDAEKVVGYPTSFMNLRCLLSDEFANMALYLRKLVTTISSCRPPKTFLYGDSKNLQPWGLIILLLSKSVKTNMAATTQLKTIEEQQRILAELTEMIRTGHLIHQGIVNVPFAKRSKHTESAIFGNKIAILLGDYLLVHSKRYASRTKKLRCVLHNIDSVERFAGEDYEIVFDTTSISVEDVMGNPRKEWTARTVFNGVSLLGRGCQSAMVLDRQNRETQNSAYHFGCHVGLAWQAAQFCLASAPVLFALEGNPDLYKIIDRSKNDVKDVDYEDLKFNILKTDAVDKTKLLYEEHAKKATSYIESIGQNEAVDMIKKLINTF
ncbi:hypothetical protein ABMA27_016936 [Loxostege sticticalis]|uniref:Uncharacterized protein n=1 Tax=Loxostege sticticalis TaxID=481309 RepID=A0ABR3GYK1_LOXSC